MDFFFWLRGDDQHSVWNQIYNMMWNDIVFRILVNECRRVAKELPEPRAAHNGALARFLDQGYVATQVLAIRRLVELASGQDDRQPISIKRVLRDIRQSRDFLTRENYIAYDGLPYDYAEAQQTWLDTVSKDKAASSSSKTYFIANEGSDAWFSSLRLHKQFDKLSGVSAENRERTDVVAESVFEQISSVLAVEEIREVRTYADKFIAHASDPLSRSAISDKEMAISMDKLTNCHKALVSVTQMISGQLLCDTNSSPIPTPQYNFMEHLELPWVPEKALEEIHDLWRSRFDEVENWPTPVLNA